MAVVFIFLTQFFMGILYFWSHVSLSFCLFISQCIFQMIWFMIEYHFYFVVYFDVWGLQSVSVVKFWTKMKYFGVHFISDLEPIWLTILKLISQWKISFVFHKIKSCLRGNSWERNSNLDTVKRKNVLCFEYITKCFLNQRFCVTCMITFLLYIV